MRSVADELRSSLRERLAAMSPDERVRLTACLAEDDLDLFCAARQLPRDVGRRLLVAGRRAGRRPSAVIGQTRQ
jgi:hypothetical protein